MTSKISRAEELCGTDPRYPEVLSADVDWGSMRFSLRYRFGIRDCGGSRKIEGVVEFSGMSSDSALNDWDARDYLREAEAESVESFRRYVEEQNPGPEMRATLRSTSGPWEYSILGGRVWRC